MYKFDKNHQFGLADFNQPMGLKMNPENRWVKKSETIPWEAIEEKYAALFPSKKGMPAKPLRTSLGSLLIQKQLQFSDRELVEEIRENPYFQYFIGLPGYQDAIPFVPSLLVEFRKRLTAEVLEEINEMIIAYNAPDDPPPTGGGNDDEESETNSGTLILDATCAPQNISYPQDVNLLNEAREKLEKMIDIICYEQNYYKPRMYRQKARKDYLNLAKCKKRTAKKIRKAIKAQLQYIRRDLGYIDTFLEEIDLCDDLSRQLATIRTLVEQQQYMYDNKVHKVENRIVSISQPWIRPIVRGKVKAPVEFGAKLDLSIDAKGYARIENISFDAYNESTCLPDAVNAYYERTGYYPERVLADQIYRTRDNRAFCQKHGIRLSGPKLGRPSKETTKTDKQIEYQDNTDRIEVERRFSLTKRCYGMGKIMTRLEDTQLTSIALSVFVANIVRMQQRILSALFYLMDILNYREGWLPAYAG